MTRYQDYHIEDFLLDASFQSWVRYGDQENNLFWTDFRKNNPAQAADINAAEILLRGIYYPQTGEISDEEIQVEIAALISRIQSNKLKAPEITSETIQMVPETTRIKWWWWAAAVVFIGAICLGVVITMKKQAEVLPFETTAAIVENSNTGNVDQVVTLSDGTVITLRPASTVRYAQSFDGKYRQVSLSGEALFKVAKDAEHPFVVYANNLVTRVLGTTFLVRAVKGENASIVEVTEGKVSVYRNKDFDLKANGLQSLSKGVILTANQKMVFQQEDNLMTKSLVDEPAMKPSVTLAFVYRNAPVSQVLKDIEHAYQIDINFDEELLKNCPVTATLSGQTLLEKVEIICETVEARYEVLDGQIVVYGKKCLK